MTVVFRARMRARDATRSGVPRRSAGRPYAQRDIDEPGLEFNLHTLLTFVDNSVIVALLASFLIR